jgi:light-regulated signal transduction histidine kinase (bacteriophytochrome)
LIREVERLRARVAWLERQAAEGDGKDRPARDEGSSASLTWLSHELRNRLGSISNAAYYLRLVDPTAAKVNEYLELLDREVKVVKRVIADYQAAAADPRSTAPSDRGSDPDAV